MEKPYLHYSVREMKLFREFTLQLAWAQLSHQISIRLGEDPPQQDQGASKGGPAAALLIGCHHLQLEASFPSALPAQPSPAPTCRCQLGCVHMATEGEMRKQEPRGLAEVGVSWPKQREGVNPHGFGKGKHFPCRAY